MNPAQFSYSAYGLQFVSDRRLSNLIPHQLVPGPNPDLQIHFIDKSVGLKSDPAGELLWYTTDILDERGNPGLRISKGKSTEEYFIRYINGLTFCIDRAVSHVSVRCTQPMDHAEICSFLLGPVMGIVLRMKGIVCLHASAVEVQGKAVAFAGPIGTGKSTTAAIFANHGHPVLTDDIVALEKSGSNFLARPGYPLLNLMPDSMALVFAEDHRIRATNTEDKAQVILDGKTLRFQNQPLPTGAIYILQQGNRHITTPEITCIRPKEALIALASETYANKMLDPTMRASEFEVLGEIVKSVPVRRLITPVAVSPRDLYDAVSRDAATAVCSTAVSV